MMALFSIRNERDLVVLNGIATETTAAAFATGASAGEGAVVTQYGTAPAGKTQFKVLVKHLDGRLRASDVINPDKLTYFKLQEPVSEVLPKATATIATATVGDLYEIIVKIYNDGSLGRDDCMLLSASYVAVTGNDVTAIATGLVTALKASQTRMGQDWFTISNAAGVITLQSKALPFVTGKKDGRAIDFNVQATQVTPSTLAQGSIAVAYTAYVPNPCSINYLKDLEYQTRGAFGDDYRGLMYPNDFELQSDVVSTTTYHLFEFGFYDGDQNNHAVQKSPRHLTVAVPAANAAAFAALIATCTQTIDLSTAATDGQQLTWSDTTGTYAPATDV